MHDVTTKENYQDVYICTGNWPNENGYFYQDLKSVGKEKENHNGLVTN